MCRDTFYLMSADGDTHKYECELCGLYGTNLDSELDMIFCSTDCQLDYYNGYFDDIRRKVRQKFISKPKDENFYQVRTDKDESFKINHIHYGAEFRANPTIELRAGKTYIFDVRAPGHPFWIKTNKTTGKRDAYWGVKNNGTQNGQVELKIPSKNPPTELYYNCEFHDTMRGIFIVKAS